MTVSPYLQARRAVSEAIDVEHDARQAWLAAPDKAKPDAWDLYVAAGLKVVEAEAGLEPFAAEMRASAARSQFYAQFGDLVRSKEDAENIAVAGFLGPAQVPKRAGWVAFCERAKIDPDFDPGAALLTG